MLCAQEAPSDDAGEIENIVVTGSRIKKIAADTPHPVTVIDREMLEASGNFTLAEALRTLPYNNLGADSKGYFAGGKLSLGTMDLRGLGANRTLTLVNGRRMGSSPQASGEAANFNNIPTAAIERVEVLRDGASAIYGSDAIGGVINVILRDDYDGWEAAAAFSDAKQGGSDELSYSIAGGFTGSRGRLTWALERTEIDAISDGDRAPGDDPEWYVIPGNPVGDPGTWFAEDWFGDGTLVNGPMIADPNCPPHRFAPFGDWTVIHPVSGAPSGPVASSACSLEGTPQNEPFPEVTGTRLFATGRFDWKQDVELFGMLLVSDVEGRALASTGGEIPNAIAAENPINPGYDPGLGTAPWSVSLFHGLHQLGDRVHTIDSDYFGITGGALIGIENGDLEVGLQLDREDSTESVQNLSLRSAIRSAIADGSFNPFQQQNDQAVVDALRYTQLDSSETIIVGADVTWRSSFTGPGGREVAYAAGGEFRHESYDHDPDAENLAINVFGWFPGGYELDTNRNVLSAFVEVDVPLADRLGVIYAGRFDDYSDPDDSDFTNKLSLRWRPHDTLLLRANWGEGFRVPSNFELAASRVPDLAFFVFDELRCSTAGYNPEHPHCVPVITITSEDANADLEAETSDHFSAGFAWQPTREFAVSADYWSVDVDNQIATLNPQQVLDLEAVGALPPGSTVERGGAGNILNIVRGRLNLPSVETEGVDVELRWSRSTRSIGDIGLFSVWSFLNDYTVEPAPGVQPYDRVGTWEVPEWKSETGVNWSMGTLRANLTAVGSASFEDEYLGRSPEWWHYNLTLGWEAPWDGDVSVGSRNITNKDPVPEVLRHHDYIGRVVFLKYRQQF